MQFSKNISVLPPFVSMGAFKQVKNSGKSMKKWPYAPTWRQGTSEVKCMKKSANADVVINSNDFVW